MEELQVYKVYPAIPEPLAFLDYLARNLWWCWNHEAVELFHRMNPGLWKAVGRNPVTFLSRISQRRFEALSEDESFLGHLSKVKAKFECMFSADPGPLKSDFGPGETVAYFSMEFGLHESLPFFAGGLGVLAGDHLKASSSLGISLTGIGLLFREGYFRQFLDHHGWQQETYPVTDVFDLPLQKVTDAHGRDLIIEIPSPRGTTRACVWRIMVGRIRLVLLDANLNENPEPIREITSRLYDSRDSIRLAQEVLLGIGGMMALEEMNLLAKVCHMNEGHSALAGLERTARIMDRCRLDFHSAFQISRRSGIFTTHTPVKAGHDEFDKTLVRPYVTPYANRFGIPADTLLSWGEEPGQENGNRFSMFVFGAKSAGIINGVSRLHGQVARRMWQELWPKRELDEIPISHVTNGVHIESYLSRHKNALFERYLASDWSGRQSDPDLVRRIDTIEDADLWHVHELDRSGLIQESRQLLLNAYERRNAPRNVLDEVAGVLDHRILTICFGRRFATYKRAALLLNDIPRLTRLITDPDRPVQLIFAGKAHPDDDAGKAIIKQVVEFARHPEVRHRVAFLENYDINIARYMVQGCDVWLNTPRRPNEACGTSGMKAAANGGLNLSILDGWWCEGFREDRGWRIGDGDHHDNRDYQDELDCQALFNVLENDIIPVYYDRKPGAPPLKWIRMMKAAMKMAVLEFSSDRMVREYASRFYIPAARAWDELAQDSAARAKALARTEERLMALWPDIRLSRPSIRTEKDFTVGDRFIVSLDVCLGELAPEEVEVQIYHGRMRGLDRLAGSQVETMVLKQTGETGTHTYECSITCSDSGRFGYTARVVPSGDKVLRETPGLMTWVASQDSSSH